MLRLLPISYAS